MLMNRLIVSVVYVCCGYRYEYTSGNDALAVKEVLLDGWCGIDVFAF